MKKNKVRTRNQISFYFWEEKGILLVITLTGILYNLGMVAGPWFEGQMVQYLWDITKGTRTALHMLFLVLCYVLTIGFVQLMRYFKRLYVRKFANNISKNIKMNLFHTLLFKQGTNTENSGSMMTKIISDGDACVEGMRKFTTEVFDTGVVMVAYLAMLLSYDWRLTLLSLLFPPIAYWIAEKLKGMVTKNVAAALESNEALNHFTLNRVTNALTYRVYGQETNQNIAYETYLSDYEKKAIRANIFENALQPTYQVISMAGSVVILWFGGKNVLGKGWSPWDIAAFTTFFSCYQKLALKASKGAKLFNAVQKAKVSWKRIQPYLMPLSEKIQPNLSAASPLQVRDLSFAYEGHTPLFSPFSFSACPGQWIGITGKVACGKSTLGRLFTGELSYQGKISLGDHFFSNAGDGFETSVGYLGHQLELFSGTIEENICLGRSGDILPVLKAVCIDQEVSSFPEGAKTRIGNGGIRLSGGQQARIALARTLYHKRPLLILDDPFAAIDMDTEQQIYANIRRYAPASIVLFISHRLELFPKMEQVLWIEQGKVQVSTHKTLMETSETYRSLYHTQQKEDKEHEK